MAPPYFLKRGANVNIFLNNKTTFSTKIYICTLTYLCSVNLILDIGNTRTKIATIKNRSIVDFSFLDSSEELIKDRLVDYKDIDKAIVSNVNSDFKYPDLNFPLLELNHRTPIPFKLDYKTPTTLGLDRIALVASAVNQYPNTNCLVIDAGTCITYDFVNASGMYKGGGISPGLSMRLKSLAHYTSRLPKVSYQKDFMLIGDSTESSILSGAVGGFKREIEATIGEYKKRYPSLITIITGGDIKVFDYLAKNSIFAAPDFLLLGLNHILEYNAERL